MSYSGLHQIHYKLATDNMTKIGISTNPEKRSTLEVAGKDGKVHVIEGDNLRDCMKKAKAIRGK